MSDTARVFVIPAANLPTLQAKLSKLSRRAAKLGIVPPSYNVIKEEIKTVQVQIDTTEDSMGRSVPVIEDRIIVLHHITLSSSLVILAGYEFCASIEHTTEGNILHTLKGKTVPLTYRDCKSFCDHCKVMRRRNDTFIVRHVESNRYLQVGRNCLKDFLGVDAERYAAIAELYYECDELAEASESMGYGGNGPRFDYLDVFLSYTAEVIAHLGWKSNSVAKEYGGESTSTIAYRHLHPRKGDKVGEGLYFSSITPKSQETSAAAIEWCIALSDKEVEESDYLHNIRVIAKRGIVGEKQYGYAASIVSAYQRAKEELVRKERKNTLPSSYVGNVGDKVIISVLVNAAITLEGHYGYTTLHIMSDKEGNVFKWNSSSVALEKGKEYTLRGTVKRHEEYKGVKQTTLSHCSEVILHCFICQAPGGDVVKVMAEEEKDARCKFLEHIGAKRLAKGTMIAREVDVVRRENAGIVVG